MCRPGICVFPGIRHDRLVIEILGKVSRLSSPRTDVGGFQHTHTHMALRQETPTKRFQQMI